MSRTPTFINTLDGSPSVKETIPVNITNDFGVKVDDKKEIKRLIDIIVQHEQRWAKICAILQVDKDNAPHAIQTLRLLKANAIVEKDETPAEVIEARKYFPALNDLHGKIDDAITYEFERLNRHISELSGDDVTKLANHLARGIVDKHGGVKFNSLLSWLQRWFVKSA
jgi:hypothetical protein